MCVCVCVCVCVYVCVWCVCVCVCVVCVVCVHVYVCVSKRAIMHGEQTVCNAGYISSTLLVMLCTSMETKVMYE